MAKAVKHRAYSYEIGGKKILVPPHTERPNPHVEMMAVYYVAYELEHHGWNVGFAGRETQEGFDLYAERKGHLKRVEVKGRTAGGSGFGNLRRDARGFDMLVGVLVGAHQQPKAFIATDREIRAIFRNRRSVDKNEWRPFAKELSSSYLDRWDKFDRK